MVLYSKKQVFEMQKRPYEMQLTIMQSKMIEACVRSKFKIYVAFSGGKDSAFLLYHMASIWAILKEDHENLPLHVVNNDTTVEYLGMANYVKNFVSYIETKFGIKIILHIEKPRNKRNFVNVIKEIGIPIVSKEVAANINSLQKWMKEYSIKYEDIINHLDKTEENVKYLQNLFHGRKLSTLYLLGYVTSKNEFGGIGEIPKRWIPLLNAPFKISAECCSILKHSNIPDELKNWSVMTGEMAEESRQRLQAYQQSGCNSFNVNGIGKSKPMGPMTLQTVLRNIKENNIPIHKYYGSIEIDETGKYYTTGMYRTGCAMCCFGLSFSPDRFVKLYELEPARVKFAFKPRSEGGLGYKEAFEYCNKYCGTNWEIPNIEE